MSSPDNKKNNVFVAFRVLIGLVFIISGIEKIISPYQNFLYVIESYEVIPAFLELFVAHIFPWIELILGIFVVLGLWTKQALVGIICLLVIFIGVVSQAIIRNLPITECGCFGELLVLPLPVVVGFDSTMFVAVVWLFKNISKTSHLSLDSYFTKNDEKKSV